jgi:hypothetical protein
LVKNIDKNQLLASFSRTAGGSQGRVGRFMEIDPKTLRKHYSRELDQASDLIEGAALRAGANYYTQTALTNGARFFLPRLGGKTAPFPDFPLDSWSKLTPGRS